MDSPPIKKISEKGFLNIPNYEEW